jgi:formylglycine-generating enzyme required for sulfatase activity
VASVWQLAGALCYREPGTAGAGAADEWGALLAGQALAESSDLARVAESNLATFERVRRSLLALMRTEGFPARERATAGRALAAVGDPRFDPERWYLPREPALGFVEVPAGSFWMGSDKERDPSAFDNELPAHEVTLPAFYMARFPVTVAQFRAFVKGSGRQPEDAKSLEGPSNHPVVYVTWNDALAYCGWLNERLVEMARERQAGAGAAGMWSAIAQGELRAVLPSEAEWEKAARGTDGRISPWGDNFDANRANSDDAGVGDRSALGCFPGGSSPYGCEEMSGNVWEWTRSSDASYPYVAADGREDLEAPAQRLRVLRGGAFYGDPGDVRCAIRSGDDPRGRDDFVGFRVVLSPFRSGL